MLGSARALGRLKPGVMNKTETAYADALEARRQSVDREKRVVWWKFEGVKLRLADNCFLTPDFLVLLATGELQVHDVKGARAIYTDDAKVKMKVAAGAYPFRFFACFPRPKRDGGGWDVEEV